MKNEIEEDMDRMIQEMNNAGMSSEEIKNALASMFIPASELGYDTDDFTFNPIDMSEQLYYSYTECLKVNDRSTFEHKRKNRNTWAAEGQIKGYQWYALTNYYNPKIHAIDTEKEKENKYFRSIAANQTNVLDKLFDIINDVTPDIFTYAIRAQALFCNSADFFELDNFSLNQNDSFEEYTYCLEVQAFEDRIREGFGLESDFKVIKALDNKQLSVSPYIKDANIIFFDIMLDEGSRFTAIADTLMKLGARSVIGVFVTRICPTILGKYPDGQGFKSLAGDDYIDSFAPQFYIDFSKLTERK